MQENRDDITLFILCVLTASCVHLSFLREIICQTACKCSSSPALVDIAKKIRTYKEDISRENVILHSDMSTVSWGKLVLCIL
jgi:hypothetical protein